MSDIRFFSRFKNLRSEKLPDKFESSSDPDISLRRDDNVTLTVKLVICFRILFPGWVAQKQGQKICIQGTQIYLWIVLL